MTLYEVPAELEWTPKCDEHGSAKPTRIEPKVWLARANSGKLLPIRNHAVAKDGSVVDSEVVAVPVVIYLIVTSDPASSKSLMRNCSR